MLRKPAQPTATGASAPPALNPGLVDLFAPVALEFGRTELTLGSQVGRVLIILDYPPRVGPAWLARLFGLPGVIGSLHLLPSDPAALVKQINSSVTEFSARLTAGSRNALLNQRTEQSLRDAQELLRKIDQEQQQVFSVTTILLVLAPTKEELEKRTKRVQATAAAAGLRAREATFLQWDGLTATGPWAWLPHTLQQLAPRNIPSETIAAAFPFLGGSINHGRGVVMGRDGAGGLVIIDRWNPPVNLGMEGPNMVVLARTRAGKSFSVKGLCLREYQNGAKLTIIDPEREYLDFCRQLGGVWVDAAGGGLVINPLQVRSVPLAPDELMEPRTGRLNSPLAQHLQRVRTFFYLYLRDLSDLERAHLQEAVQAVYQSAGITWETDPASITEWPTLADLHAYIAAMAEHDPTRWERLAILLQSAAEGPDSELWVGTDTLPEQIDVLVLDVHNLHSLPPNVQRAQYFNVLTYTWDLIRRDRQSSRKMLVVDEAWYLADPDVPAALDFLREMSKRIAKYGGSLTTITQNVGDFLSAAVAQQGEAVVGNATYKWLLRQGERDLETLARLLNLSDAERDLLASARRGEGLLIAGNQRVRMSFEAAPHELPILDPKQAAALGLLDER